MNPVQRVYSYITRRRIFHQQWCWLTIVILLAVLITTILNIGGEMRYIQDFLAKLGFDQSSRHDPYWNMKAPTLRTPYYLPPERLKEAMRNKKINNDPSLKSGREEALKKSMWLEKIDKLNRLRSKPNVRHVEVKGKITTTTNVHIFYYTWYENLEWDGHWQHWDHRYMSKWEQDESFIQTGRHRPPEDIGSNFYPRLGCYSSRDLFVIDTHMRQIRDMGIGVLVVSWYPPGMSNEFSVHHSADSIFRIVIEMAKNYGLKVAPHIQPYLNRNPITLSRHLRYFVDNYGMHPALYKVKKRGRWHNVYYIYDSYLTPAMEWRSIFDVHGNLTLRGTDLDGVFLGLLVERDDKNEIIKARFDGFYTYIASNGYSYGSTWKNWMGLSEFAKTHDLFFIPSVGPGYTDTRVRPWNTAVAKERRSGRYYDVAWRAAINTGSRFISITSFNHWHEGTQIEPAVPKSIDGYTYLNYDPEGPEFYLNLTKYWVNEFKKGPKNPVVIY